LTISWLVVFVLGVLLAGGILAAVAWLVHALTGYDFDRLIDNDTFSGCLGWLIIPMVIFLGIWAFDGVEEWLCWLLEKF
jgi:hypothetical protein